MSTLDPSVLADVEDYVFGGNRLSCRIAASMIAESLGIPLDPSSADDDADLGLIANLILVTITDIAGTGGQRRRTRALLAESLDEVR